VSTRRRQEVFLRGILKKDSGRCRAGNELARI
jgi:hypothetical protein